MLILVSTVAPLPQVPWGCGISHGSTSGKGRGSPMRPWNNLHGAEGNGRGQGTLRLAPHGFTLEQLIVYHAARAALMLWMAGAVFFESGQDVARRLRITKEGS